MNNEIALPENEYFDLLKTAITQIKSSRNAIALQVNTTANSTYWSLGKLLHERKIEGGYGSNVINRLSVDLKSEFPDMGLSPRNLWNMKLFYERYAASDKKLLQLVALLQWGHNLLLINKMNKLNELIKGGGSLPLRAHFVGRDPLCGGHPRNAPVLPHGFDFANAKSGGMYE